MKTKYTAFIDFDGTITTRDVGYEMFKKFTAEKTEPIVQRYRRGEVNSYECLKTECEIWNQAPPLEEEVLEFLQEQAIAPGFNEFIGILKRNETRKYILSEGFDFYIDRIMKAGRHFGLERITNKARYEDGLIAPEFPHLGDGCGECSNCKGYHIRRLAGPRESAVFIGDGHSDYHGADAADIVFAKSFLAGSLKKTGRHYFEFADFYDIIDIWNSLTEIGLFASSERLRFCTAMETRQADFRGIWENGEVMKNVGYPQGLRWSDSKYEDFWKTLGRRDFILFAIENDNGEFLGEAKLSFPDSENCCCHDVKLLPEFQGNGYGKEAWHLIFDLARRRWPEAVSLVSPSVENTRAIKLYESLGFVVNGAPEEWIPETEHAVPVTFREMIKKNNI